MLWLKHAETFHIFTKALLNLQPKHEAVLLREIPLAFPIALLLITATLIFSSAYVALRRQQLLKKLLAKMEKS